MKNSSPHRFTALRRIGLWLLVAATSPTVATHNDPSTQAPPDTGKAAHAPAEIVTVRPPAEVPSRQGLPYFVGISEGTAGAKRISMNLVVIPPGGAAKPHLHKGYETAVYILKGRVETRYGRGLKQSVVNQEGDFLYIPPDLPHQPHNLSATEPAMAIVARNDPNEQESVVPYDPETDD